MRGFERLRLVTAALTVVVMAGLLSLRSDAAQEVRVALVIGNAAYTQVAPLRNTINDARAIAQTLEIVGFRRPTLLMDLKKADLDRALLKFGAEAARADVALIYYAGHGIEVDGNNYLVPVDATLANAADVDLEAVRAETALRQAQRSRAVNIVILDACRDNPFTRRMKSSGRSIGARGLAAVEPGGETLLAFAAKAGATADDNPTGNNSPFVQALIKHLVTPGLELRLMFGRVRDEVLALTKGRQEPYTYGTLGGREFYFVPKGRPTSADSDPSKGKLAGQSFRDCEICPEMVVVPGGAFLMGSPEADAESSGNERPQHRVTISSDFAVSKFEITFGEWDACVATGGCRGYRPTDTGYSPVNTPAIKIGWEDAKSYVAWINSLQTAGRGKYRLLSEAEWEYAARAGTTTPYPWGSRSAREFANYGSDTIAGRLVPCGLGSVFGFCDDSGGRDQWQKLSPRGSFPANRFGLYDMHGNVWEWTEDCWNNSYHAAPTDGRPWTTGDCSRRVLRGGSWVSVPQYLRSADRNSNKSSVRKDYVGFRLARTL